SNAAGRDGSALRMLKLFRDRPLLVGDVRTGTIPSLLPSQKHYLKVYRSGPDQGCQRGICCRQATSDGTRGDVRARRTVRLR
ncbi:MAG: hypothetical protein V1736_08250, partial [Pseudomonadota bacterium]